MASDSGIVHWGSGMSFSDRFLLGCSSHIPYHMCFPMCQFVFNLFLMLMLVGILLKYKSIWMLTSEKDYAEIGLSKVFSSKN